MEVRLLGAEGAPDGTILSLVASGVRRQVPLSCLDTLKFPASICSGNPLTVELLNMLGTAHQALQPGTADYSVPVKMADGSEVSLRLGVSQLNTNGDNCRQPQAGQSETEKSRESRHRKALKAKDYLDSTGIIGFIQAMLQCLVNTKPEDPFAFMAAQLQACDHASQLKQQAGNQDGKSPPWSWSIESSKADQSPVKHIKGVAEDQTNKSPGQKMEDSPGKLAEIVAVTAEDAPSNDEAKRTQQHERESLSQEAIPSGPQAEKADAGEKLESEERVRDASDAVPVAKSQDEERSAEERKENEKPRTGGKQSKKQKKKKGMTEQLAGEKSAAQGSGADPQEKALVLGRYRVMDGAPLGRGAWCIVRRAVDTITGNDVAVKAYNEQAARELGDQALASRFTREIQIFQSLGVGPTKADEVCAETTRTENGLQPQQLLVNLLDFSKDGTGEPGKDADGAYYTVLELADESLESWLQKRLDASKFVSLAELCEVASAVASGLAWLHSCHLCHLDIKPENIMRFGDAWKLIDLEGCLSLVDGGSSVRPDSFTPLYASPELARFALSQASDSVLPPSSAMDAWAAGVVLLDVLAHTSAFQETKSGFDSAALFDGEEVPFEGWYNWIANPDPVVVAEFITAPASSVELLLQHGDLKELLGQLLEKDPTRRLSADKLRDHPLVVGSSPKRSEEA